MYIALQRIGVLKNKSVVYCVSKNQESISSGINRLVSENLITTILK